jgi:hypothetical protein
LIQGLIDQSAATQPDRNALLNRALRGLDRALLLLRASVNAPVMRLNIAEDIAMLQSAKDNLLLRTSSLEEVKRNAESAWEAHARQDGFIYSLRECCMPKLRQATKVHRTLPLALTAKRCSAD